MTVATFKPGQRLNADDNRWEQAKEIIGSTRVTLGPQASQQWLDAPEHLAMVLSRYRAAAALIGDAPSVLEIGCGEGIGVGILKRGRRAYYGIDTDAEAIAVAPGDSQRDVFFAVDDALREAPRRVWERTSWSAVVSLDVIEHIPAEREDDFMWTCTKSLDAHGVCVVGTPSKHAEHLASPQSKAGHINLYTPDRLKALVGRYFHVVQMLYLQDVSVHFGHPEMAHYLIAVGIGPKRG